MAQQISPMQLLVSIVERGKGAHLVEHYKTYRLFDHMRVAGRGTAASHLLDTLGFSTTERDIVLSFGPKDTVQQLMHHLKDEDRSKLDAQGIAFSLDMTGMSVILAICLSRLEQVEPKKGEELMEQSNHHSLILVSVNQGYSDAVMDTARAAGARGGTIIRARWVGAEEVEKFAGITLQSEKEVVAIVAQSRDRNAIMESIDKTHGLRTPTQATVVSLPIDQTVRLD